MWLHMCLVEGSGNQTNAAEYQRVNCQVLSLKIGAKKLPHSTVPNSGCWWWIISSFTSALCIEYTPQGSVLEPCYSSCASLVLPTCHSSLVPTLTYLLLTCFCIDIIILHRMLHTFSRTMHDFLITWLAHAHCLILSPSINASTWECLEKETNGHSGHNIF